MDDIDDILASVDRDQLASSPESTALDHQQLTRFWVAERGVPEVLPWPGPLMERVMERLRKQVEIIEDLASSGSDLTSGGPTSNNPSTNPSLNLKLSILQTDLSRTQYLLRSLFRQRLSKLTKHSIHYLLLSSPASLSQSTSQQQQQQQQQRYRQQQQHEDQPPLSDSEITFLRSHQSLLTSHYHSTFLSTFPPQLRNLDDNSGGVNMVQGPETKSVVFVRCLGEEVSVVVSGGEGGSGGGGGGGGDEDDMMGGGKEGDSYGATMRRGEVWVVRWEGVKGAWKKGEVEVL